MHHTWYAPDIGIHQVYSRYTRYTCVHPCTYLAYTGVDPVYICVQPSIQPSIQPCIPVYTCVQPCTPVYTCVQPCIPMYTCVRPCIAYVNSVYTLCYLKVSSFPIHFYGNGQQLPLLGSHKILACSKTKISIVFNSLIVCSCEYQQ